MLLHILILLAGLVILYIGAELMVRSSSRIAIYLGIRPLIVGLTVVAFSTSMPEFVVSIISVLKNTHDIAVGNIIGSNICNIGLIVGLSALVRPMRVDRNLIRREMPVLLAVSGLFWLLILDGSVDHLDGVILFTGILLFTAYLVVDGLNDMKNNHTARKESLSGRRNLAFDSMKILAGIAGLVTGANLMVQGAVSLAQGLGVSELMIGLSIIAVGTSLPELATSLVASARGRPDIGLGNAIGSNIFNLLLVVGLMGTIHPVAVSGQVVTQLVPVMILFTVLLIPIIILKQDINRLEGAILLSGYFLFILWIYL